MRDMRTSPLVALAMAHLAIAALYATHVQVERQLPPSIERPLRFYGDLTGAHVHFNFFAPQVAPQARALFDLIHADGRHEIVDLATGNNEADQRVKMIMTFLGDPQVRVLLMHSWCRHFLDRRPDVVEVAVRVDIVDVPTMAAARAGAKPQWLELDRYHLHRD